MTNALKRQEGGAHYKNLKIQPVEYIHANGIGYFEGNVIKYVTRWKDKNGLEDLKKAKHYIELLIDLTERSVAEQARQELVRAERATPSYRFVDEETDHG